MNQQNKNKDKEPISPPKQVIRGKTKKQGARRAKWQNVVPFPNGMRMRGKSEREGEKGVEWIWYGMVLGTVGVGMWYVRYVRDNGEL